MKFKSRVDIPPDNWLYKLGKKVINKPNKNKETMKFSSVACLLGSIQAANISNWTPMQELAQVETLAEAQVLPGFEVTPTTTSNDIMYVLNVLGKSQDNIASW